MDDKELEGLKSNVSASMHNTEEGHESLASTRSQ
jgi:hypothetical protein